MIMYDLMYMIYMMHMSEIQLTSNHETGLRTSPILQLQGMGPGLTSSFVEPAAEVDSVDTIGTLN